MAGSLQVSEEAQSLNLARKRGGWITFVFIAGALGSLTLASGGWVANLIVYLIEEFHVKSIDATQIANVVNGCTNLFPVIGAVIADTVGSFSVITASSIISLLGIFLFVLSAIFKFLRPQPCEIGSSLCKAPSVIQLTVLYAGVALGSLGLGGTRFTLVTMGADQLDSSEDQEVFFNWCFFVLYIGWLLSTTAIVYIQDNVSWAWGFGLSFAVNVLGLVIFVLGKRFYRSFKSRTSPFVGLARVIFSAIRKRKVPLSNEHEEFYHGKDLDGALITDGTPPTKSFRFLNRAAVKTEGDIASDGSVKSPWTLCTVQQVENFKAVLRIFPIWTSSIFLHTPIAIQASMTILQALTMDRHLGSHFKIPAGSMLVLVLLSTAISLSLFDNLLYPTLQKLTGRHPTPFQRIGVGHVLTVLGMAISALVESRRLKIAHEHNLQLQPGAIVPMLALWLFPQFIIVGIGEAFHFPGQVAFYYQEFPTSLKNTATSMISLVIGVAYYLSTFLVDIVTKKTSWLPNNINNGRLDYLYWMLAGIGVLNFGYYLVWTSLYKYKHVDVIGSVQAKGFKRQLYRQHAISCSSLVPPLFYFCQTGKHSLLFYVKEYRHQRLELIDERVGYQEFQETEPESSDHFEKNTSERYLILGVPFFLSS